MKKSKSIRNTFGFSQSDMAGILQISRAQWSMHESGKRPLPKAAMVRLADIIAHMQGSEAEASRTTAASEKHTTQALKAALKETHYQLLLTRRKIAAMEEKCRAHASALRVSQYLAAQPLAKTTLPAELLTRIATKAKTGIQKYGEKPLGELHAQELLLQQQHDWLSETLQKKEH